jgi:hypothetical protein
MELTVMPKQRSVAPVVAMLSLCVLLATNACQSSKSNIIRRVDHILIASNDAEELFSLLSNTFQFPVVWPVSDYGFFTSGGVAVGNVNLEVFREPVSSDSVVRSRFAGFALEPEPLQNSLLELEAREITHGPVTPFTSSSSDGSTKILWTTVMLPNVSNDAIMVFLCEYAHDVGAQRERSLDQLQSRDGGPLSVESVREIVIGTTDMQGTLDHWQHLLYPLLPSSPGVWQLESGPAIRVIHADKDGIQELVINVSSLARARRFLREQGLLGIDRPDELTMAGPRLQGLNIRLVEKDCSLGFR